MKFPKREQVGGLEIINESCNKYTHRMKLLGYLQSMKYISIAKKKEYFAYF